MPMNFEAFQATRVAVPDIGAILNDSTLKGQPGLIYCGSLYIDRWTSAWIGHPAEPFAYHLILGRDEWCSNDLTELERLLYQFALDEGFDTESAA
jgi:hypothetical protein